MLVSTLIIRCVNSAIAACILFNAPSGGGGGGAAGGGTVGAGAGGGTIGAGTDGAGAGGGTDGAGAGGGGGVLFDAAGLAAGGAAMSIPVACLNMASISDCGITLPSLLIACSIYCKKIHHELYSAREQ